MVTIHLLIVWLEALSLIFLSSLKKSPARFKSWNQLLHEVLRVFRKSFSSTALIPFQSLSVIHIYNLFFKLEISPSLWKMSYVTLIPNLFLPNLCDDFRVFAITPSPSEVFERLLRDKLQLRSDLHFIIPEDEFGFVPGKSVHSQLIVTINNEKKLLYHDLT